MHDTMPEVWHAYKDMSWIPEHVVDTAIKEILDMKIMKFLNEIRFG